MPDAITGPNLTQIQIDEVFADAHSLRMVELEVGKAVLLSSFVETAVPPDNSHHQPSEAA
jgi:hypothetical protein